MGMPSPSLPPAPAMPKLEAPKVEAPKVPAPTVAAPSAPSNILLIVIFCLVAFLAGGVVVYLLLKH
jgi:hypothetical protein